MATSSESYGVISDIVDEAKANQSTAKRKANTVTTGAGLGITTVLAGLSYLVESGTPGVADWVPLIVALLGGIGTVAGVSFTPNGVTDSVAKQLNDVLNQRIDAVHEHGGPVQPQVSNQTNFQEQFANVDLPVTNTSNPDELLDEARRLAGG